MRVFAVFFACNIRLHCFFTFIIRNKSIFFFFFLKCFCHYVRHCVRLFLFFRICNHSRRISVLVQYSKISVHVRSLQLPFIIEIVTAITISICLLLLSISLYVISLVLLARFLFPTSYCVSTHQ